MDALRSGGPGSRRGELNDAPQVVEHAGGGGDDEVVVLGARKLGPRAGLRGDERAGRAVPDLGVALEVRVDASTCDPAQLQCRRPEATKVARAREDPMRHLALDVAQL